jgi:hypothetical protein
VVVFLSQTYKHLAPHLAHFLIENLLN